MKLYTPPLLYIVEVTFIEMLIYLLRILTTKYTIIYFYLNIFFIVGRFQNKGGDARRKNDNRVFRSRIIYYNTVHWISLRWRIDRHKHCTLNREKRIVLLSIFVYIKLYFEKRPKEYKNIGDPRL